jgi:hypothetical protein
MQKKAERNRSAVAPELRRRLRARERRIKVLRRRVGAVTLSLFLLSWAAVYAGGELGRSTSVASAKVALVTTTKSTSTHRNHHAVSSVSSSGAAKSTASAASTSSEPTTTNDTTSPSTATATAVTTRQS